MRSPTTEASAVPASAPTVVPDTQEAWLIASTPTR